MGLFGKKVNKDKERKDANSGNDKTKKSSMKDLYKSEEAKKSNLSSEKKKIERKFNDSYRILTRPLVTEKASIQGVVNKYFFEVNRNANKIEVAKAVQDTYGVKPAKVNIITMEGKNIRQGRISGKRKKWKKAVVTLKKGDSIKIYEGV